MPEALSVWQRIRLLFGVLALIRFSLLVPALLILTLLCSDQMSDALIALADWHESGPLAASAIATGFAALVVWYTARTMFRFRFNSNAASDPAVHTRLKRHLPRVLSILVPGALLAKMLSLYPAVGDKAGWLQTVVLFSTVTVLVALYVALRRWLTQIPGLWMLAVPEHEERRNLTRVRALPGVSRAVLWALLIANVAAVGLALFAPIFLMGSVALLCLALGLSAMTGSAIIYLANHHRAPVLTLLALWVAFWSFYNDNHAVRQTAKSHSHGFLSRTTPRAPASLQQPSPLASESVASYFDGWFDELAGGESGEGPVPVIIVAADGGGIRAAYWTAGVLSALQDATAGKPVSFARHIFAISGVSGGSLGAATFAAIAARRAGPDFHSDDRSWLQESDQVLGRDFLAPTLSNALFIDLPQRFLPLPTFDDRAIALEKSWEASWRKTHAEDPGRFRAPFHDLWRHDSHQVPLLFLNGTVVETGQRAILDPLATDPSAASPFVNAFRIGPSLGTQVPLSTAVLLSARFTYVSPAGLMGSVAADGSVQWQRIVDGGYFDYSGSVTAQELAYAVRSEYVRHVAGDRKPRPMRLIILHIDNDPQNPRASMVDWNRFAGGRVWLGEALSPVRSLLNTRPARARQATQFLALSNDDGVSSSFIDIMVWRGDTDLPLGWSLSSEARAEMDRQLQLPCPTYTEEGKCAAAQFADVLQTLDAP
jgi:hypothetical protein